MEPVSFRLAAPQDAAALSAFARQAFSENFTHYDPLALAAFLDEYYGAPAFLTYLKDKETCVWLAQEQDTIIGYAGFGRYKLPLATTLSPIVELHRLYVLKPWQGRKIGAAMMERLFDFAKAQAARAIYLGVWENNSNAQEFYQRYGFAKVGEYDYPPVGDVVDREWILQKIL